MAYIHSTSPHRTAKARFSIKRIGHMISISRQRRALRKLSTQQLRDMGISVDAAIIEANRPFWDLPSQYDD